MLLKITKVMIQGRGKWEPLEKKNQRGENKHKRVSKNRARFALQTEQSTP